MPYDFVPELLPRECAPPQSAIYLNEGGLYQAFSPSKPFEADWFKSHFGSRSGTADLKPAAVLIALIWRGDACGWHLLLTRRSAHLRAHAGEIALPGGRRDASDADDIACALREATEEIALPAHAAQVLGTLPVRATGSGWSVRPVVAVITAEVALRANACEVEEIFEIPLDFVLNPRNHFRQSVQQDNRLLQWWAMPWKNPNNQRNYYIWGATAGILRSLYDFLARSIENQGGIFNQRLA